MEAIEDKGIAQGLMRTFRELSEKDAEDIQRVVALLSPNVPGGDTWSELLKSQRILVVAEAGAGKTFECQQQQRKLWDAGEPSFFFELSTLARTDPREMLDFEAEKRFDSWLTSQSDIATFFLDSIDELKLTLGSFEQALRRFNRSLAGQLGRARIVITTRPIPYDQQTIKRLLPVPQIDDGPFTADRFADIALGKEREGEAKSLAPVWRNVGLMPLTDQQIRQMAIGQNVADVDELMADIQRRNAEDFARRPQDLIELCVDWNSARRIRTHREQVAQNVAVKLLPRRAERAALSGDMALDGARRLALAALLTRKLTIRHNAEADKGEPSEQALDPAIVLSDWSLDERETLLERPLFGFASYGRVRFHHRSVIEYLAADQIDLLLAKGMPVRSAKRLLFAETAQGSPVVRPPMRPVAAWLASRRAFFFREVLAREPEVLLNFGDPQSLDPEQRRCSLRAYVARYGSGGWRGLRVPFIQAHRFVSLELADEVNRLWADDIENSEVRELLLTLIELGPLHACDALAADAALADATEFRERFGAVDALIALNSPSISEVVRQIETRPEIWTDRIVRGMVPRLFPNHLSVDQLHRLLMRVHERTDSVGDVSWQLPRIIAAPLFPEKLLDPLRNCLTELIAGGMVWSKDWPHYTTTRPHLTAALAEICIKLMDRGVRTASMFRSVVLAIRFGSENSSRGEPVQRLRAAVNSLSGRERESVFWTEDGILQGLHNETKPFDRLWEVVDRGALDFDAQRDAEWILVGLGDARRSLEDRAMLLEAALRFTRPEHVSAQEHGNSLRDSAGDCPPLIARIDDWLKPPSPNPKHEQWARDRERRKLQENLADAKSRASWIAFWNEIANNPDSVLSGKRADNTVWNLWRAMSRVGAGSRSEGWNRRFIEGNFGKETADRLRLALRPIWRRSPPTLAMERKPEERNTIYLNWQLGLAAIAAESEDPNWAVGLNSREADAAARHIPVELNSFPAWTEALVATHPDVVDRTIGAQLTFELQQQSDSSHWFSSILQNIEHAPPSVAELFVPRLREWLERHSTRLNRNENVGAAAGERLSRVLRVLIRNGDTDIVHYIRALALRRLKRIGAPFQSVWLPVLLRLDPARGIDAFERILAPIPIGADSPALDLFGSLFGDGHGGPLVDPSQPGFTPNMLLRLARLAYTHVRRIDDVHHEGTYSPDRRDDAERGRGALLSALLAATGSAAWSAKIELANDPMFAHFRDRAAAIALEKAAEESDCDVITDSDVTALNRFGEAPPATFEAMFSLMHDRLDDIDELLLEDVSPRESWATIKDERVMRRELARELRNRSNACYTVDQEAATADEKETDIRLRAPSGQQAAIELKIGEKPRSAADLRAAIKDQLVTKYMAAEECRAGSLVITIASNRTWSNPDGGNVLDFASLIEWLNGEARVLVRQMDDRMRLFVKGVDLRPRLTTEQKSRSATRQSRSASKTAASN